MTLGSKRIENMETHFQQELNHLKKELLKMAGLAEKAIASAIDALVKRDTLLAEKTIREDKAINEMELEIDDLSLKLLALHQPMAADLRFITSAMRINIELERIGDLAVNISERVLSLNQEPQLKPYIDLPRMAEISKMMVKDVLDAFVQGDADLARAVCERDNQVDDLKDQVFRELLSYMISDTRTITRAVQLIIVSRYLERIADHATNIAEGVIFMVKARVIKHHAYAKTENPEQES